MKLLSLSYSEYSLPLNGLQPLAELNRLKGVYSNLSPYSQDLLAGMNQSSWQRAEQMLEKQGHQGPNFDYAKALNSLPQTRCESLQTLHHLLNKHGGDYRLVKLRPHQHLHFGHCLPSDLIENIQTLETSLQAIKNKGEEMLVYAPLLVADVLHIAPFIDGNRRVALLLLRQLLEEAGHKVLRYVDIESELIATEKQLYHLLNKLFENTESDEEAIQKWLRYWWVLLQRVYQRFERQLQQTNIAPGRGSKTQLIENFVRSQQQPFQLKDVCTALPTISPDMVRTVLRDLRDRQFITTSGRGRGATWSRVGTR